MKRLLPLLLLAAAGAHAGVPRLDDFAYGYPLALAGDAPLHAVTLPDDVYRYATRDDLGDLRVFNGDGEPVPYSLRPPPTKPEAGKRIALPIFPLYGDARDTKGSVRVITRTDGSTELALRPSAEHKQRLGGYLIDASALKQPLVQLHLALMPGEGDGLVSADLSGSQDLSHWRLLRSNVALGELRYGEHRFRQDGVRLAGGPYRYLRLRWRGGQAALHLTGVSGELRPTLPPPDLHWRRATATHNTLPAGNDTFRVSGRYPISRVRVMLPQTNTVAEVRLYSRTAAADAPWESRYRGVLYDLRRDGHQLRHDTVELPPLHRPQWRVEVDPAGGGLGRTPPGLQVGWTPGTLLFVARGPGPFTLAFGAAGMKPAPSNLAALNTVESAPRPARVGKRETLGGERRLIAKAPALPWRRWLLWGVLLGGVLALALMARGLYREMEGKE